MTTSFHIAIAGATGAVGIELLSVLEKRQFPVASMRLLASPRSAGKHLTFRGAQLPVSVLDEHAFEGIDIAFFSAGGSRSLEFAAHAAQAGAVVIDNSSAFRMDDNVPLVIPEINPQAAKAHKGIIANPNCSTIAMLIPLYPLHHAFGVKRVSCSTYQASSGAGAAAMEELRQATRAVLDDKPFTPQQFDYHYGFNLFPHDSPLDDDLYCEEEVKMVKETAKILDDANIAVHATCIRVPVLRAHSEALNIEFSKHVSPQQAYEVLSNAAGIRIFEDRQQNKWATPHDATAQDDVLVGRIRADLSQPNTLDVWVVCDQLLKGAALNAVQIAELL